MSNWIADLLVQRPDLVSLPVHNRDRFSIHFRRSDGLIETHFTGSPCHFQDMDGAWKPIDTKLVQSSGGFYGSPGLDYVMHPDGRLRIGQFQHQVPLPGNPIGRVDGDKIIREFPGGRHIMFSMENGYREEIVLTKPFPCKAFISRQSGRLSSRFTEHPMLAVDAKGQEFVFLGDPSAFDVWLDKAFYPVVIDPDFTESTNDGFIRGQDTTYATARSTSGYFDIVGNVFRVGQLFSSPNYSVWRSFLKFDTSSIGSGSIVTQVNLNMICTTDSSTTDFDVHIVKQDWSADDPITTGNREDAYDNCLSGTSDSNIWRNTNGMSLNTQYISGDLSTSWVSKIGNTWYSLRSSRDYSNTTPSGAEHIQIASQDHVTAAYRPTLTVAYSAGSTFIPKIIII